MMRRPIKTSPVRWRVVPAVHGRAVASARTRAVRGGSGAVRPGRRVSLSGAMQSGRRRGADFRSVASAARSSRRSAVSLARVKIRVAARCMAALSAAAMAAVPTTASAAASSAAASSAMTAFAAEIRSLRRFGMLALVLAIPLAAAAAAAAMTAAASV